MIEGVGHIPRRLQLYLLVVILTGVAIAVGLARHALTWEGYDVALIAILLGTLAALSDRFLLNLSHQVTINVATAAQIAMILTLPAAWPALLVMLAIAVGHALRRAEWEETLFNVAQGGIYVAVAAGGYHATLGLIDAPSGWQHELATISSVVVASILLHLANTLLVSVAVALQLRRSPLRTWFMNMAQDLWPHLALTALGFVAAVVAMSQPLALPLLAIPVILVRHAVRQMVQLRADTAAALAALVEIVELRDPYTAGHSRRVGEMARALALELGLTVEEADALESAGRVHDIGKLAIDPLVLTKPGKLDDAEWAEMQLHPVHGATVLARFNAYEQGYALVRHHHEAWDGSGYPDRLAGDDIPLGARILAVADTWDALTSNRPYRSGMDPATARRILEQGAGEQWDARVVAALIGCLDAEPVAPRLSVVSALATTD
ncbi:MAG TPA: HD-GYP domain-containing protein [Thermomicrobiales bacterium]|nr:HD-GYP domain-containing protein [Thermomicrobiales bacterium]